MGFWNTVAKAARMDSERAANYIARGSKNALKLVGKAEAATDKAVAAGFSKAVADRGLFVHNASIRARQMQLARRNAIGAVGVGVLGSQGKRRSSYRPSRPMTQAPPGTGRYA